MEEPIWLSRALVDSMQFELIREHGGLHGVRDDNLIESALARPRNRFFYDDNVDLATLAAAYGFGFATNHGYVDGNKRIALMAMFVFLYQNGFFLDADNTEIVVVISDVITRKINENELAEFLRTNIGSKTNNKIHKTDQQGE